MQAGLVAVKPAGSSGATAMRGTNWSPMLEAVSTAGRARAIVLDMMMNASSSDLMLLAWETDMFVNISSSRRVYPRLLREKGLEFTRSDTAPLRCNEPYWAGWERRDARNLVEYTLHSWTLRSESPKL